MKAGLDAAGLSPYLMVQPLAYHTPDAGKICKIQLMLYLTTSGYAPRSL